ncbi:U-box domain-containing protein 4 [Apostasia shenzhenica]|uniref:U-box domain-containing protein 4 n=1 Tax=Apostasia shenzhenica TaxID=1088818 RepID=A0A2I0BGU2_9ASPA|nr:U-box domain-containing protein 4 [Apostasia shenzhenica]
MEVKRRTARTLVKRLGSASDAAALAATIAEIRLCSKQDEEIRLPLADAGAVPLLSRHLLAGAPIASASSQADAAAALLNVSISDRETLMSTPGLLDALAHSIRPASPAVVAQNAAATVFSLLAVESYRPIIGSKKSLISALIDLIRSPNPASRTVKDALKALFGIALYPLNRAAMVELGVVPALISLVVKKDRAGILEDATAVIAQVAGCFESLDAFRRAAGFRVLVDLVEKGTGATGRTRENAVAALLNLSMSGGDAAVAEIRELEEAEAAVRELADGGVSARAKVKAEALLRVMASRRGDHWIGDFELRPSPQPSCSSSTDSASF